VDRVVKEYVMYSSMVIVTAVLSVSHLIQGREIGCYSRHSIAI
jgi:hypothetical protein